MNKFDVPYAFKKGATILFVHIISIFCSKSELNFDFILTDRLIQFSVIKILVLIRSTATDGD